MIQLPSPWATLTNLFRLVVMRNIQIKRLNRRLKTTLERRQIGVDSRLLDMSYAPQWNTMQCWAATTQIALKLYGLHVDQRDLSYDLCGLDQFGNIQNCGAKPNEMNIYLNGCGFDNYGVQYCVKSILRHDKLTGKEVFNALSNGNPIVVGYREPDSLVGHAVLITGASVVEDIYTKNGIIENLILRDPANTPFNVARKGRRIVSYENFSDKIYAWWVPQLHQLNRAWAI